MRNNGELYAKAFGGWIRLYADGSTSRSKVRLDTLALEHDLFKDQFGKLCIAGGGKRKPILELPSYVAAAIEDHSEENS